jgi:hypothetical protein
MVEVHRWKMMGEARNKWNCRMHIRVSKSE